MRRLALVAAAFAAVFAILHACGRDGPATPSYDRSQVVVATVRRVIAPAYVEFEERAEALEAATRAWASDPTPANLEATRTAWREARAAWKWTEAFDFGPADDFAFFPVCAFHKNMRPDLANQAERSLLREKSHIVDSLQSRQNSQAVLLRSQGTLGPLNPSHRGIRIKADNQDVPEALCLRQVSHMAGVKEVKTTVRENDFFARSPAPFGDSSKMAA